MDTNWIVSRNGSSVFNYDYSVNKMKYNKVIEDQYQIAKLKRELREIRKKLKEVENIKTKLELYKQSKLIKLREYWIKRF